MDSNTTKLAMNGAELQASLGCSRRAARDILRRLGRRVGGRVVVPVSLVREWLERPQGVPEREDSP